MTAVIGAMVQAVGRALGGRIWQGSTERQIQETMAELLAGPLELRGPALPYQVIREHVLGEGERIDFGIVIESRAPNIVGIEVKIDGSTSEVVQQVARYCRHDAVGAIILATTSRRLATAMPREWNARNHAGDWRKLPIYSLVLRRM